MLKGSSSLVLAGDIGGTNARLRLYESSGMAVVHEAILSSRSESSLGKILGKYLERRRAKVSAAVLGVAGPVVNGISHTTNLPWVIDAKKLGRELGIPRVWLLNDLAAAAVGCTRVAASSTISLTRGRPVPKGNIAVIAAGTGLGEALLVWDHDHYVPLATEGGHADFGPTSSVEIELLMYLYQRGGGEHVSYERILSGSGLGQLYDFFEEREGEDARNARRLRAVDRPPVIAALGLSKKSHVAWHAVDLFARIYGAEAGNLALKGFAVGGVFLCGKIAATLLPPQKATFLEAFREKGRMSELLSRMPITIVTDSLVGLTGAGYLAAHLASR